MGLSKQQKAQINSQVAVDPAYLAAKGTPAEYGALQMAIERAIGPGFNQQDFNKDFKVDTAAGGVGDKSWVQKHKVLTAVLAGLGGAAGGAGLAALAGGAGAAGAGAGASAATGASGTGTAGVLGGTSLATGAPGIGLGIGGTLPAAGTGGLMTSGAAAGGSMGLKSGMSKLGGMFGGSKGGGLDWTTLLLGGLSAAAGIGQHDPGTMPFKETMNYQDWRDKNGAKPIQIHSTLPPPAEGVNIPGLPFQIGGGLGRDPALDHPDILDFTPSPSGAQRRKPNGSA